MTLSIRAAAESRAPRTSLPTAEPLDPFFLVVNELDDALLEVEDAFIASDSAHRRRIGSAGEGGGTGAILSERLEAPASFAMGFEVAGAEAVAPLERLAALFPDENSADVARLLELLERKELPAGHVLWRRDEEASAMAFVAEGQLASQLSEGADAGQEIVHPGNLVGDYAFLVGDRHTTTLTSHTPCVVFFLDRQGLKAMVSKDARIAFMLARLTISYLGHRTSHVSNHIWESHCVPI
jgi:CRP-like cAMP-binding protein